MRRNAMVYTPGGLPVHTCAILAANWASELGFRRSRQVRWALAGLLLGPIALQLLYACFVRRGMAIATGCGVGNEDNKRLVGAG
jgi:hypothetical protein